MTNFLYTQSMSNYKEPVYNIGAVSRLTGITQARLRAWEHRYGFIDSKRTPGGHRLYSEADIQRLRWVENRIEEGMQVSQAIQALRIQELEGRLLFGRAMPNENEALATTISPQIEKPIQLSEALILRNTDSANQILEEALASTSPECVILDLITPTLSHIGEYWDQGKITVADEHFASNYLYQKLQMWMSSSPPPLNRPSIVLSCAPEEWHEGSLLVLGALLRRRRWPIFYLGQCMPMSDLATFVHDSHPGFVVLVAMSELSVEGLLRWTEYIPKVSANGKPQVGFGGRIFNKIPELQSRIPGIFLGSTFEEGLSSIERLLS